MSFKKQHRVILKNQNTRTNYNIFIAYFLFFTTSNVCKCNKHYIYIYIYMYVYGLLTITTLKSIYIYNIIFITTAHQHDILSSNATNKYYQYTLLNWFSII